MIIEIQRWKGESLLVWDRKLKNFDLFAIFLICVGVSVIHTLRCLNTNQIYH